MTTRREFLGTSAAAGALLATPAMARPAASGTPVRSLVLRDETILRNPQMNGDNWHLTWAEDDRQYASLCDGYGAFERPPAMYNSRLIAVEGGPRDIAFHDVPAYPALAGFTEKPRYYNFGVIALGSRIYQFLSTWPVPLALDAPNFRFMGVKAIWSPDLGRTWYNQDGSTPVRWEGWSERSRRSMLFFEEDQGCFSMLSVLQMGKGYAANRDGYVYVYAPNGSVEGTMNQLVMFRVAKDRILDRDTYEYFAGPRRDGGARWSRDIMDRAPVCTFPSGWVNKWLHPWAWVPSVTWNEPLGLYMMANWATRPGRDAKSEWFQGPSYLGFWTAPNPWGPWTQIHETTSWSPGGDGKAGCYSPIIAPKWIAPDGKSFWLVWTDFQEMLSEESKRRLEKTIAGLEPAERARAAGQMDRFNRPFYAFNLQRVDLTV